jgi:hypothetical protein
MLLVDEAGQQPQLLQRVSEPKTGKNRMHFDIKVPGVDEEVSGLDILGARRTEGDAIEEHGTNEFCVCDGGSGP